jgi:Fe-S-cluster containining protein
MTPSSTKGGSAAAVAALCSQCGLCCNGVLFGDVELQGGDAATALSAAGLELFRKGRKRAFSQPCACYVNGLCQIYEHRPRQCRAFECRQVQRVAAGEASAAAALKKIQLARQRAAEVLRLVRAAGNTDETEPLNHRYAAVMAQPIDFAAGEAQAELRGELMLAVAKLVETLEQDFFG